jgi:DNA (cytosine-5)-methyltransferase 1
LGRVSRRNANSNSPESSIQVVDFFSGCGGTSAGLRQAGCDIVAGIDSDPEAAATFRKNFPQATHFCNDIGDVKTAALEPLLRPRETHLLLFSACAPCQPFSKQRRGRRKRDDDRVPLLLRLRRFIRFYNPELLFVENVPGLQSLSDDFGPFTAFVAFLKREGYSIDTKVIESSSYGVPQRRRRLVLLASRLGPIAVPKPTHGPGTGRPYSTVWDWIGHLPPIAAGEEHPKIPNHRASGLSPLNLERIQATPEGGGREHWPSHLLAECHRDGYDGHTDVYGRMRRDALSTGLTTRCISFSNGRFGHPTQDRAISVREAAALQTFPRRFVFTGSLNSMARQVGNAVPVLLARKIGVHLRSHARRFATALREAA